jgi:hypothetical protein
VLAQHKDGDGRGGQRPIAQSPGGSNLWASSWARQRELGRVWETEKREERWDVADSAR